MTPSTDPGRPGGTRGKRPAGQDTGIRRPAAPGAHSGTPDTGPAAAAEEVTDVSSSDWVIPLLVLAAGAAFLGAEMWLVSRVAHGAVRGVRRTGQPRRRRV